jgi:hypothetical protein
MFRLYGPLEPCLDKTWRPGEIELVKWTLELKGHNYKNQNHPRRRAAADLALGKEFTLQTHGHDKYTGDVILPDGTNVNHALVKDGWCWWYRKYAPRDMVLDGLEHEARERRKGLWADPQPVPPWVYRKARRECHL